MIRNRSFTHLFSASALCLMACASAGGEDDEKVLEPRDEALQILRDRAGAEVTLDINELGTTRVVAMTPRFPVTTSARGPAAAAAEFLSANHDVFGIDSSDASTFVMTGLDVEPKLGMSHVTLQRVFSGIPVFQGAITVHMNAENSVFHAIGDDFYQVNAPTNRFGLNPAEAAQAAATAFGVPVSLTQVSAEGLTTTFASENLADPLRVDQRIYQVAPGDNRYAYQVLLAWFNEQKEQQYWLAMVDGTDGKLLHKYNLVNTFTCRVYSVNAQAAAGETGDRRVVESCDGNTTASPEGWVGAARNTVGNNAVACTDLNANNNCAGGNEVQPVANANDAFDFPFNAGQDAALFRPAAVTNAFFLVNDFHDRTYALGFNEASRNFQTNNFGRGGAGNDPVNVDAADGSGTNNANFGTPPDGSRPRMQMFLFNIDRGAALRQDGDFDATVVYHEYSHGLSNRLVGGGSTACLGGLQSGGMGEGWGDFMSGTFLSNAVVGAYVTGDAVNGIRSAPMSANTFTYNSIRTGVLAEVHDVGELWAQVLWDARNRVGKATIEQLVVSGMKLTPCQPTMLGARDGIIQADANINGGANRCALWAAFAKFQMGTGASSPNHNSTTQIVTSTAVPADCGGGGGGTVVFTDDFEANRGWTTDAGGTATTGQWVRGNPVGTTSGAVTTQNNTTPSGVNALVTGIAGGAAGAADVDGGQTSITSPAIAIPAGGTVTLSMSFYFAHLNNAGADDFFRVFVVNAAGTATQVFQELGAATNDNANYAAQSINISQFAGQTVRIRFSAADNGTGSLIEAAVDNVQITRQ
jgi:extracellular elastinolytic metalloproteinase